MTRVSITPQIDSERVAEIVKRHGSLFTVSRSAYATDFIGASFLNMNEFIHINCECHNPPHTYWISVHEVTSIDMFDGEQGKLDI